MAGRSDSVAVVGWKKVAVWLSAVVVGLGIAALGVYLVLDDLERADMLASVAGACISLVGLGLTGYGLVIARRAPQPAAGPGAQVVERADAEGDVDVVDGVAGSVHLGRPGSPASGPGTPGIPVTSGEQTVRDVTAKGHIRVIRGVGGDVESH